MCWIQKVKHMHKVRLSEHDLNAVIVVFGKHFLKDDRLWLFGSRADLSKKGGDIDFYIETRAKDANDALKMKSSFLWELEHMIGEQKIDVVINMLNNPYPLPIHEVAKKEGVQLV